MQAPLAGPLLTPPSSPPPVDFPVYTTSSISDFVHAYGRPDQLNSLNRPRTGRKTWKSLKEKKEAVWPEYLEEALLEALARYRPTSSKDPRSLRRFPKRNAFISNYIKQKTAMKRSPKQVGSRLQQLRETCTEPGVIRLICSRDFDSPDRIAAAGVVLPSKSLADGTVPDLRIDTSISEYSPTSSNTTLGVTPSLSMDSMVLPDPYEYPVTPYLDVFDQQAICSSPSVGGSWPHAYVQVSLAASSDPTYICRSALGSNTAFTLDLDESGLADAFALTNPEAWKWQHRLSVATSVPVCYHTPSVTFSSSILSPNISYESLFRVQRDHKILFEEHTPLEHISDSHSRPSLFRTSVLPKYWGTVANKTSELNQYMIIQNIYESAAATDRSLDPIYTVVFNFDCSIPSDENVPEAAPPPYFSSSPSFRNAPMQEEVSPVRLPLAPILQNTAPASHILRYNPPDFSLLSPIHGVGESQGTGSWYNLGSYLGSSGHFYSTNTCSSMGQADMDNDQLAYPSLYPF